LALLLAAIALFLLVGAATSLLRMTLGSPLPYIRRRSA
jgi:hypothetical protein